MRDHLVTVVSDADLAYKLPGRNPTLGELLVEMGDIEGVYTHSFETFTLDWAHRQLPHSAPVTIASLQDWFEAQDDAMNSALSRFTEEELHVDRIDPGHAFDIPRMSGSEGTAIRHRLIAVDSAQLSVTEHGNGPPLVLCSGGPGLPDYLGDVAGMVDDIARVYRFDPRGSRRSSGAPATDLRTLLSDLESLRHALGHEQWIVGGHSFGADLALAYALEYPDGVRGLLYVSGTGVQDDRQWHAAYEAGRAEGRDPPPTDVLPDPVAHRAINASWREYIKQPTLLRRLSELAVPVLAVHGAEDVRPSWPVEQLVHLVRNGNFARIAGADHCPWRRRPEELKRLIRAFVTDLARNGRRVSR